MNVQLIFIIITEALQLVNTAFMRKDLWPMVLIVLP